MSRPHTVAPAHTVLGVVVTPDHRPEELLPAARAADDAGIEQLWLWEDCFQESGIAPAAAVLAATRQLTVGIGLLPVPLRNVALAAMEIATVEGMFPGRFVPGIGHGVLDWMGQVGARAKSPVTLLTEYTTALRALLHGDTVTTSGEYVQLTDVALDYPPAVAPPLVVGGRGPKTVGLAGALADGVILDEYVDLAAVRTSVPVFQQAREAAGRTDPAQVITFIGLPDEPAGQTAERIGELTANGVTHVVLVPRAPGRTVEQAIGHIANEIRPLVP